MTTQGKQDRKTTHTAPQNVSQASLKHRGPFRASLKDMFATPVRQRHLINAYEARLMLVAVREIKPDKALAKAGISSDMLSNMLHVRDYLKPENRVALMGVLRSMALSEPDCQRLWEGKAYTVTHATQKLGSFERQILDCYASGWTRDDIKEEFGMSDDSVNVHTDALIKRFKSLGAENEYDLAAIGLVSSIRGNRPVRAAKKMTEAPAVASPFAGL